jgi:dihydrofolate reductase
MRKIVVTEFVSLDGVMEEPKWTFPYWNDEIAGFKAEETNAADAMLLGRVTYEGFAAAWPNRTGDGAEWFNGSPKHVVSTTLEQADWNNSHLIKDNVVEEIARLKEQPGKNLVVYGSGKLVQTLIQHDLVDEYRLLVYPLVMGMGQRLFEGEGAPKLALVRSQQFSSGVVGLVYTPDRGA